MTKPVIFFDGLCNLCNSSVQFVIERDKNKKFLFASLQSELAKNNLPEALIGEDSLQTIVLKKDDKLLTKSTAALTIARTLSGLWPMLYLFILVPSFIRDFVYDLIGKNRYKWFGKKDHCMIPSKELKSRFLD
ncbi:thiol-disulfide oxidoreductase DCC [Ochromonadaceae sp. CCMP2298]|nr:thiol-disulfide oxidoreductase DCC [Ochromonadaceae sp. CCMP2298]